MVINEEQLQAGIVKFIDNVLAPKADSFTKFKIYFFVPSLPKYLQAKINDIRNVDFGKDIFTEDGGINLDVAYNRAIKAIERSGSILLPKLNYFVDKADIDALYAILKAE